MAQCRFKIGDKVAMSAAFLRSIGDYSHDSASMRGTVVGLIPFGARTLVRIKWCRWRATTSVLDCNLIHANRIHLEPV